MTGRIDAESKTARSIRSPTIAEGMSKFIGILLNTILTLWFLFFFALTLYLNWIDTPAGMLGGIW